jgi:hypothetical protein
MDVIPSVARDLLRPRIKELRDGRSLVAAFLGMTPRGLPTAG